MKKITVTAAVTAGSLAALGLGACGGSVTKASSPPSPAKSSAPKPAPSTPAPLSGPVGTTFKVSGTDNSGNSTVYTVTLVQFLPVAQGADYQQADPGHYLAGAKFRITGVTGNSSDDSNNDAQATGNDSQVYEPAMDDITSGTNFNSGDFQVSPGQTQIGWVSFQLPNSAKVTSIQWSADGFMGGSTPGTWKIS